MQPRRSAGIASLKRLLADGWGPVNLRSTKTAIFARVKGTNLRAGLVRLHTRNATNFFELGVRPEEAALILRNSPEVVRHHYLKLERAGKG